MAQLIGLALVFLLWACSHDEDADDKVSYARESANAARQSLAWDTAIRSVDFGLAPNPKIDGKTLRQVITSQVVGRDDGELCSACHNKNDAQGGYGGLAAAYAASPSLGPNTVIDGRKWSGPGGWAERFVKNPTKPANLQLMVRAWINGKYK